MPGGDRNSHDYGGAGAYFTESDDDGWMSMRTAIADQLDGDNSVSDRSRRVAAGSWRGADTAVRSLAEAAGIVQ